MLEKTINLIDTAIAARLNSSVFIRKNYGLCKMIVKEGASAARYPASVTILNETKAVIDSKYSIISYHRVISESFDDVESYGDANDARLKKTVMLMVIWADGRKLKMTDTKLRDYITAFIPTSLNVAAFSNTQIELQSDTVDSFRLFAQEYDGQAYKLHPDHIFFGVNYTVISEYNSQCITLCEDC